jgi:hypothetical protein
MIQPNKSKPHAVRASATLTGSYVAGNVFSADEHNTLGLLVQYTKGNETSAEIKIESSIDGGVTYGQEVTENASGGEITETLANRKLTASGNYWIVISPIKSDTIKVSVKATGGTPTGTMAIDAQTSYT